MDDCITKRLHTLRLARIAAEVLNISGRVDITEFAANLEHNKTDYWDDKMYLSDDETRAILRCILRIR